jgi:hypothetical protein
MFSGRQTRTSEPFADKKEMCHEEAHRCSRVAHGDRHPDVDHVGQRGQCIAVEPLVRREWLLITESLSATQPPALIGAHIMSNGCRNTVSPEAGRVASDRIPVEVTVHHKCALNPRFEKEE